MAQELYLNILEPQYSRYISLRPELEAYLKEMYPEQSDFQVKHANDRWSFKSPHELTKQQCKDLTLEIVRRREEKAELEKQKAAVGSA